MSHKCPQKSPISLPNVSQTSPKCLPNVSQTGYVKFSLFSARPLFARTPQRWIFDLGAGRGRVFNLHLDAENRTRCPASHGQQHEQQRKRLFDLVNKQLSFEKCKQTADKRCKICKQMADLL